MSYSARERYRHDPAFRSAAISASLRWSRKANQDPVYRKITNLRKKIVFVRNSYQTWSRRAEQRFRQLERLIAERDRLHAEWKRRKTCLN